VPLAIRNLLNQPQIFNLIHKMFIPWWEEVCQRYYIDWI